MTASVRPEKLREALNSKLGHIPLLIYELEQAEAPELNRYWEPARTAVAMLHAARGVVPVAQAFAGGPSFNFGVWYESWRRSLTGAELSLWDQLRDDRVAQEHGEGAPLTLHMIPITRGTGVESFSNYVALGIPPSERHVGPSKGGIRFAAFPDRPASAVARDYLAIARKFVDNFLRDHASLIP